MNQLPVETIAERLDDRFRILTGGERTALPRQQTMRAAIDWSYNLLSAREQRVFERLSVFAGGCTLAAAATVCGTHETVEADVFDVLASLVDKSLLLVDFESIDLRYRLLESFKEYAREKLEERGELEIAARRHARAYLKIAEYFSDTYDTTPDLVLREHSQAELNNWRAALKWSLAARADIDLGQRLVAALSQVWSGYAPVEGRRWIDLALGLAHDGTPVSVSGRISYASAALASVLYETKIGLASSEKALALYRQLDDRFWIAVSEAQLGNAHRHLGRNKEAAAILLASLTQLRELGARRHLGYALRVMSAVCLINGDFTAARNYIAEALAIYKAINAARVSATTMALDLAEVELCAGNPELAFRYGSEALPTLRAFEDMPSIADTLNTQSACLISLADYEGAEAYARESLVFASELHSSTLIARALQRLAVVAALRPQDAPERRADPHARAARLFGFIDARLADFGSFREPFAQQEYERTLAALRGSIGSERLAQLMDEGATMDEEQAIDEALEDDT